MVTAGDRLGLTGSVMSLSLASAGVRPPFFTLHLTQQQTMLVQLVYRQC